MVESKTPQQRPNGWGKALRQSLLVVQMLAVEASVTLEIILMIANIQTLGVPIRYATVPGMVSAVTGAILIPSIGFMIDHRGQSKSAKAKVLILASCFQIVGNLLIFLGNTIKLLYYDNIRYEDNSLLSGTVPNISQTFLNVSLTGPLAISATNNHPVRNLESFQTDIWTPTSGNVTHLSQSDILPAMNANSSDPQTSWEDIPYYAKLGMIGYALEVFGYDSSGCFLKTFALSCTSSTDNASIIVKATLMSSFGGCLIAVLGSVGLGDYLTAGTGHDGNAAQCALLSALCLLLLLSGLTTTLTTGFCCPPHAGDMMDMEYDYPSDSDLENSGEDSDVKDPQDVMIPEMTLSSNSECPANDNHMAASLLNIYEPQPPLISKRKIVNFFGRYKQQIIINISMFFLFGASYSFEAFSVNFVGEKIFGGDPAAPVDSPVYHKYLEGIQTGSLGTLIYYIGFTIINAFHEKLLAKLGWKMEILLAGGVYIVINLLCALTAALWSYFLAVVWTGVFKTVIFSVPYILAHKFAIIRSGGKDSSLAIALVAAMLPSGLAVCLAVMGPLIDVTGNPAMPLYYTASCSSVGVLIMCSLRYSPQPQENPEDLQSSQKIQESLE